MKKIILIPAYEPDHKLNELVCRLAETKDTEMIIVNDGSSASCESVFLLAELGATVLNHESNRGKGAALKTGLSYIYRNFVGPYVVVTADADGQHAPEDIIRIGEEASAHPGQLMLGSRKIGKEVPLRSRFGNTLTRKVFRRMSGASVYDTQTGLRGFTDVCIPFLLEVPGEHYEYEMNVLLWWAGSRKRIRELWIDTIYLEKNQTSHFRVVRDSYRIYRDIFRYAKERRKVHRQIVRNRQLIDMNGVQLTGNQG